MRVFAAKLEELHSLFTPQDAFFMAHAVQLARQGLFTTHPNPRVGCVIVKGGEVVGEGWHQQAGQAHAEVNAVMQAGGLASGATAYVTLEPCSHFGRTPPCAQALLDAGIANVISAMEDPNPLVSGSGHSLLKSKGVNVRCGLLREDAQQLNPGFIKRMTHGLPWVRVKSAMSVDARTAMASGESQWITGTSARQDVQKWRARSEAIITGIESVLMDDPSLTVRPADWHDAQWPESFEPVQPLRVVLDSQLRTPLTARLLTQPGKTLIVCTKPNVDRQRALEGAGAEVLSLPGAKSVDLNALLCVLGQRDVNEVLVETGATSAGAFFEEGLVDEWIVYMAPVLMGSNARPVLSLPDIASMSQKKTLNLLDTRQIGDDIRFIYQPVSVADSQKS